MFAPKKHLMKLFFVFISVSMYANNDITSNDQMLMHLLKQSKYNAHMHNQQWRIIQEDYKDAVVKVFSHVGEINVLQPFNTPVTRHVNATGFFITDKGMIITTAQVVQEAIGVWIQIPSLGKRPVNVSVVSICPDKDIALLQVLPEDLTVIRKELGVIPHVHCGDSDTIRRADEVLAIGYPLGHTTLKSTLSVISGREKNMIQLNNPINLGNAGGPLFNINGEVIGIIRSRIHQQDNTEWVIPINDMKTILSSVKENSLLKNPFLGFIPGNTTQALTDFLGNPQPGGCVVVEVIKDSVIQKAGLQSGDMIYAINGVPIDSFGEMTVSCTENKIHLCDYLLQVGMGLESDLLVYRNGTPVFIHISLDSSNPLSVRMVYPQLEGLDYEIIGGMVVMELTVNHINILLNKAPGLSRYLKTQNQLQSALVITHIFPASCVYNARSLMTGFIIKELNSVPVKTLNDFRRAIKLSIDSPYLTIKSSDTVNHTSDNIFTVLFFNEVLQDEKRLAQLYHYPVTDFTQSLIDSCNKK